MCICFITEEAADEEEQIEEDIAGWYFRKQTTEITIIL